MGERDGMLVADRIDFFVNKGYRTILEPHFVTYIRMLFGHWHVTFPYKEIPSFFDHCHVTFSFIEPLSFFGSFVQKVKVSCFSDSFVQKTTQQPDGSCNVTRDSQLLYKLFKKQPLSFCKHLCIIYSE